MQLLALLALVGTVLAHGGIFFYTIDGQDYEGYWNLGPFLPINPPLLPGPSIQRRWRETPIAGDGFLSANMTCNHDGSSTTPSAHATIKAGGTIKATWHSKREPYYSWTHGIGPMIVYMARCPGTTCEGFNGSGAVWFKIQQLALKPNATSLALENWLQGMIQSPSTGVAGRFRPSGLETVIPRDLKPGAYLIRHEVFNYGALPNMAQSFPNCAQLMVEGDGAKLPSEKYLVSFPGAYKPEDPAFSIVKLDIGNSNSLPPQFNTTSFLFPGPEIWTGDEEGN